MNKIKLTEEEELIFYENMEKVSQSIVELIMTNQTQAVKYLYHEVLIKMNPAEKQVKLLWKNLFIDISLKEVTKFYLEDEELFLCLLKCKHVNQKITESNQVLEIVDVISYIEEKELELNRKNNMPLKLALMKYLKNNHELLIQEFPQGKYFISNSLSNEKNIMNSIQNLFSEEHWNDFVRLLPKLPQIVKTQDSLFKDKENAIIEIEVSQQVLINQYPGLLTKQVTKNMVRYMLDELNKQELSNIQNIQLSKNYMHEDKLIIQIHSKNEEKPNTDIILKIIPNLFNMYERDHLHNEGKNIDESQTSEQFWNNAIQYQLLNATLPINNKAYKKVKI